MVIYAAQAQGIQHFPYLRWKEILQILWHLTENERRSSDSHGQRLFFQTGGFYLIILNIFLVLRPGLTQSIEHMHSPLFTQGTHFSFLSKKD